MIWLAICFIVLPPYGLISPAVHSVIHHLFHALFIFPSVNVLFSTFLPSFLFFTDKCIQQGVCVYACVWVWTELEKLCVCETVCLESIQKSFRLRWCSTDALFTDLCFGFCPPLLPSPPPFFPPLLLPYTFIFSPFGHTPFNVVHFSQNPPLSHVRLCQVSFTFFSFSSPFLIRPNLTLGLPFLFPPQTPLCLPFFLNPSSSWKPPPPPSSNAGGSDLYLRLSSSSSSAPPLPVLCSAVSLSKDGHASKSLYPLRYVQPLLFYLYISLC